MNRVLFWFSSLGAAVFIGLLAVVLFFPGLVTSYAKDYAVERSLPVTDVSAAFISDEILPLLDGDGRIHDTLSQQVERYRSDPEQYLLDIVEGRSIPTESALMDSGLMAKFLEAKKITSLYFVAREHVIGIIEHIRTDLVIFALSNVVGFLFVAIMTGWVGIRDAKMFIPGFILFVAVIHSTMAYVNQNWFLNILLDSHMGIWYPLSIVSSCAYLTARHARGQLRREVKDMAIEVLSDSLP